MAGLLRVPFFLRGASPCFVFRRCLRGFLLDEALLRFASLRRSNRMLLVFVARHAGLQFKMRRVFQSIAPFEAVFLHDLDDFTAVARQVAMALFAVGNGSEVNG